VKKYLSFIGLCLNVLGTGIIIWSTDILPAFGVQVKMGEFDPIVLLHPVAMKIGIGFLGIGFCCLLIKEIKVIYNRR